MGPPVPHSALPTQIIMQKNSLTPSSEADFPIVGNINHPLEIADARVASRCVKCAAAAGDTSQKKQRFSIPLQSFRDNVSRSSQIVSKRAEHAIAIKLKGTIGSLRCKSRRTLRRPAPDQHRPITAPQTQIKMASKPLINMENIHIFCWRLKPGGCVDNIQLRQKKL
jgi:hypothetical protein